MTLSVSPDDGKRPVTGALLARGREAEVWAVGEGAVLKLYLDASDDRRAAREASALSALRTSGLSVPEVIEETVLDGRPGLLLKRVAGTDLLKAMGRRPWLVLRAGNSLAIAQVAVNDVPAPAQLPSMREELHDRITESPHLEAAERAKVLRLLEAQRDGHQLCHGDLHLENLLGATRQPAVIDWSSAAAGPPAADVARTLVILCFGEPPASSPSLVRRLAPALRQLVVSRYLSSYRSARPSYLQGLHQWKVIQAAARLGETSRGESSHIRTWFNGALAAS